MKIPIKHLREGDLILNKGSVSIVWGKETNGHFTHIWSDPIIQGPAPRIYDESGYRTTNDTITEENHFEIEIIHRLNPDEEQETTDPQEGSD